MCQIKVKLHEKLDKELEPNDDYKEYLIAQMAKYDRKEEQSN